MRCGSRCYASMIGEKRPDGQPVTFNGNLTSAGAEVIKAGRLKERAGPSTSLATPLAPGRPASACANDPRSVSIAAAARVLDERRRAWLYPICLGSWEPEITPTAAPNEAPRRYMDRFMPTTWRSP